MACATQRVMKTSVVTDSATAQRGRGQSDIHARQSISSARAKTCGDGEMEPIAFALAFTRSSRQQIERA